MFPNDCIPCLDIEIEDIVSGREEGEEVNYAFEGIREKLGSKDMDDKKDLRTYMK